MTFDISKINSVERCAHAAEMEVCDMDGAELGIQFMVLGAQADAVVKHGSKAFNQSVLESERAKRGKDTKPKTLEEIHESNIDSALVRVIGWKNVQQEFSKELCRDAIKRNPHWVNQIIEFSNDLRNFTKAS